MAHRPRRASQTNRIPIRGEDLSGLNSEVLKLRLGALNLPITVTLPNHAATQLTAYKRNGRQADRKSMPDLAGQPEIGVMHQST